LGPVSKTNPVTASTRLRANGGAAATTSQSGQEKEAAASLVDFLAYVSRSGGKVTRGNMDLAKGGSTKGTIESLASLMGKDVKVNITNADGTKGAPLPSPWNSDDASTIASALPDLLEKLTTTKDEFLEGRVNINQARREVLLCIPTMTEEIVNAIVAAQRLDSNGQISLDTIRQHTTTSWLYTEGIVDLPGLINLDPYITAHGGVYRAQVIGFFDGGGPVSRIEAMIDSSKLPSRIIAQRDLNELGRGYSRAQLLPIAK
jgi:hypothetical protein